jgi:Fur family transcriptional regulator, ferric uptake regulator
MTPTARDRERRSTQGGDRPRGRAASPSAALDAYIEREGLKHSRQRELIVEAFFGMNGHVTVEELVARVRKDDPRVSLATVYRTMKLLAECGLASARQFGDGQTRYEAAAGREHHDHLICRICGDIVEFSNDRIEALQDAIAKHHGFEVESHKLELYGRCAQCRRSPRGDREDAHP